MAVEILKIAQEARSQGDAVGADLIIAFTLNLESTHLIRHSIHKQNPVLEGSFGEQLKGYRKQHKLTQRGLAETIDIDHSSLSRLEHGGRTPNLKTVKAIVNGLELDEKQTINLIISFHREGESR